MRQYSLRWKLVLWGALFALVAALISVWATWILLRQQEIAALDGRLRVDARELFRDMENFRGENSRRAVTERYVPLALRDRLVEVRGSNGEILYMSPNLRAPVLEDGIESFHTREIDGRTVRIGVFRDRELTLHVGADLKDIEALGWEIARSLVIVIPIVLLFIAGGSWWLGSVALTPIAHIRQAAERITAERLDERIPSPESRDEIAGLIKVLNATFERLQGSFEQAARFSADASHQLKTPIAVLRAGIDEILDESGISPEQRGRVVDLLQQTRRLHSVAENLLLLSRADTGRLNLRPTQFDLRSLLEASLEDARILGAERDLEIEAKFPETLPMTGDHHMISMAVQSLVENAVKYNRPRGKLLVSAGKTEHGVQICIGNSGRGIPPDRAPHIFERFYRARGSEQTPGHGLGLSIARELARAHGGDLTLTVSREDWTEFCLRFASELPTSPDSRVTERPPPSSDGQTETA